MAVRTISTSIKLDGEQEFKKQMSSVNSELKTRNRKWLWSHQSLKDRRTPWTL